MYHTEDSQNIPLNISDIEVAIVHNRCRVRQRSESSNIFGEIRITAGTLGDFLLANMLVIRLTSPSAKVSEGGIWNVPVGVLVDVVGVGLGNVNVPTVVLPMVVPIVTPS